MAIQQSATDLLFAMVLLLAAQQSVISLDLDDEDFIKSVLNNHA